MKFEIALLIIFGYSTCFGQNVECQKKMNPETEITVRQFMLDQSLIRADEEVNLPLFDISSKWELSSVVEYNSSCLAVMALCSSQAGLKECQLAYDVFGLVKDKKTKKDKVVLFSEIYPVPDRIVAKVGSKPDFSAKEDPSYYFVEFTGSSVVEALKAITTGISYSGFSGVAERSGKLLFDPTENRDWKVVYAQFHLRRGTTPKALDIQAFQLDGLVGNSLEDIWSGCTRFLNKKNTCEISPWFQSYIITILPAYLNQ